MVTQRRILIIYYSHSSQTRKLIYAFAEGLEEKGIAVTMQRLKTVAKLQFPLGSIVSTMKLMIETFFRKRFELIDPTEEITGECDLILLAGPTWSYNPSGPILSFFDNYSAVLNGKKVLPFISCRGYWRTHFWQLKSLLKKSGSHVLAPLVFLHTGAEPWRTLGVFLKLAGRVPESDKGWLGRYYKRFGHTKEQVSYAKVLGKKFASAILQGDVDIAASQIVVKDV